MFENAYSPKFLGRGIKFPIELNRGKVVISGGLDLIRSSIFTILAFEYGRRFMNGSFGSRINELLEEPNDNILQNTIRTFVLDAISNWEPRVDEVDCEITRTNNSISVFVLYRIVNTQQQDSLTFPFYSQITT